MMNRVLAFLTFISIFFLTNLFISYCFYINLPENHIVQYLNNHDVIKKECLADAICQNLNYTDGKTCWGYEDNCHEEDALKLHSCFKSGWYKSGKEQEDFFWKTADFGYVKKKKNQMVVVCRSTNNSSSSLSCAKHMTYCKAKNIFLNFKQFDFKNSKTRFDEFIFNKGDIGGDCDIDASAIQNMGSRKGALMSWYSELKDFRRLDLNPHHSKDGCDVVISRPTIFMKLDAGVNMFHHFCDFINLYASQHINGSFGTDVQVIIWDTSILPYSELFGVTWKVFTDHPLIFLKEFAGKTLCVQDAMFPLLPRMVYGMYYNMPLIPGCHGSSLFRAFSEHVIHRLGIKQHVQQNSKVRITILSRNTNYRRILNEKQLLEALNRQENIEARLIDYNHRMPFLDQLKTTYNTDILIGMHGAGLTHMLFLPHWGAVFEIYNCEDEDCYYDLSRLRGIKYFTWTNMDTIIQDDIGQHPTVSDHKKFANYSFDVDEFIRIVNQAVEYVQNHSEYIGAKSEFNAEFDGNQMNKPPVSQTTEESKVEL